MQPFDVAKAIQSTAQWGTNQKILSLKPAKILSKRSLPIVLLRSTL
jgi:hypothetical protein